MAGQLWPPVVDPSTLSRQVWDARTAESIPAVAKALQVYQGTLSQMALDSFTGTARVQPRSLLLQCPDLSLRSLATFIAVSVGEWWIHGNTVALITARKADGWPAGMKYYPAHMWWQAGPDETQDGGVDYYLNGRKVPRADVVHVQRGAAAWQPWRGVGVLEQHLEHLDGVALQSAAERANLKSGGVPSVAVVAPNTDMTEEEQDEAALKLEEKFAGPGRRPAVFPDGTKVIPLSWSANDAQMVEAQQLSLTSVANMFNLDPNWLGAPNSSHNYKSPGPLFLQLLRMSLEPVARVFEQVWSLALVPYGQEIRFDRNQLTRDDFASMVTTLNTATGGKPLLTQEEARVYANLPEEPELGEFPAPPAQLDTAPASAAGDGTDATDKPPLKAVPDPTSDPKEAAS
jgi:HK97 family phage portal protein